jgi:hypothetical protein
MLKFIKAHWLLLLAVLFLPVLIWVHFRRKSSGIAPLVDTSLGELSDMVQGATGGESLTPDRSNCTDAGCDVGYATEGTP